MMDFIGKHIDVNDGEVRVDGILRPVKWMWVECPNVNAKIKKVTFPNRDGRLYELGLDDVNLDDGSSIPNPSVIIVIDF